MSMCAYDCDGYVYLYDPEPAAGGCKCRSCRETIKVGEPASIGVEYSGEEEPPDALVVLSAVLNSPVTEERVPAKVRSLLGEWEGEVEKVFVLCEECWGLGQALLERGFCLDAGLDLRGVVRELAEEGYMA